MPNYHSFEWEDFRVRAEPLWKRKLFRFMPYFTGNEPKFKVTVDTKSGQLQPLEAFLEFLEPLSDEMEQQRELSHYDKPLRSISEVIKVVPIGMSGDHRFRITLRWGKKKGDIIKRDLVTFTAISGDRMTITIFSVVLVIIGGIIGSLITGFAGC